MAEDAKEDRLARLNALLEAHGRRQHEALVGSQVELLADGPRDDGRGWSGRLRGNTPVTFAPDDRVQAGALRRVEIVAAGSWTVEARLLPAGVPA